jgi:hypothetical protein
LVFVVVVAVTIAERNNFQEGKIYFSLQFQSIVLGSVDSRLMRQNIMVDRVLGSSSRWVGSRTQ